MKTRLTPRQTAILAILTTLVTGVLLIAYFSVQGFLRDRTRIETQASRLADELVQIANSAGPGNTEDRLRARIGDSLSDPALETVTVQLNDGTPPLQLTSPAASKATHLWDTLSIAHETIHASTAAPHRDGQTRAISVDLAISFQRPLESILVHALTASAILAGGILLATTAIIFWHPRPRTEAEPVDSTPGPAAATLPAGENPEVSPATSVPEVAADSTGITVPESAKVPRPEDAGHGHRAPAAPVLRDLGFVLDGMIDNVQTAIRAKPPEPVLRHLRTLERDLRRIRDLIGITGHEESSRSGPTGASTDIHELVEETRRRFSQEKSPKVHLATDLASDLPHHIALPPRSLAALLEILITRGASRHGATPLRLSVETASQGAQRFIRFVIEPLVPKTPPSIPDASSPHDVLETTVLAYVAAALGSHIETDGASTLWVDVPVLSADDPGFHVQEHGQKSKTLEGKQILIADDNEINRRLLSAYVAKYGARTVTTQNGEEAIEHCRRQAFDAALMDLHMPGLDGNTTAAEIRRHCPELPVVAVTADESRVTRLSASDASEFDAYLIKPVNEQALLETLHALTSGDPLPDATGSTPVDSHENDAPQHEPVFVLEAALHAAGDNEALAAEMYGMLQRDIRRHADTFLDETVADLELAEVTHKLLGGARYCGTPRLQARAERLEAALRGRTKDDIEDAKAAMYDALREIGEMDNPFAREA